MNERLIKLLGQVVNIQSKSVKASVFNAMHDENPQNYISTLLEILQNPENNIKIRNNACVFIWQRFNIDLDKIPDGVPHPFDLYGMSIVNGIVEACFSLFREYPPEYRYHIGTLLGIVASLYVHRVFDSDILIRICELFQDADEELTLKALAETIKAILKTDNPELEEVQALMSAIFQYFTSVDNIQASIVALDVLAVTLENMTELLEDQGVAEGVVSALLALSEIPEAACAAFICWKRMSKFIPQLIIDVSQNLIFLVCKTLQENSDEKTIKAGCSLLGRIAKLELRDQESGQSQIFEYSELVFLSLATVMCRIESDDVPDEDRNVVWRFAYDAMSFVIGIIADEIKDKATELIGGFIQSENFGERIAGVRILSLMISKLTDPIYADGIFEDILRLMEDPSAHVRLIALRCLRRGISRIAGSPDFNLSPEMRKATIEVSNGTLELAPMLEDEPEVAFELMRVFQDVAAVPGFQGTESILSAILERATGMRQSFRRNPLEPFNKIIEKADRSQLDSAFSTVIELYKETTGEVEYAWLSSDLTYTIEVFACRADFKDAFAENMETVVSALIDAVNAGDSYATTALIPLGAVGRCAPEAFAPFAVDVIQVFDAMLHETEYPDALYGAAGGIQLLLEGGVEVPEPGHWIELAAPLLADFNTLPNVRRALLGLIAEFSEKNLPAVIEFFDDLIPSIRVFAQTLKYQALDDPMEAEFIAINIGRFCTATFREMGNNAPPFFDVAASVMKFFADVPAKTKVALRKVLELAIVLSKLAPNDVLAVINENEDVGKVFVEAGTIDDAGIKEQSATLLKLLHYGE